MRKIVLTVLWVIPLALTAQQSSLPRDKDDDLRQAFELFDKEKFGPAQRDFKKAEAQYADPHSEIRKNTEYYQAICAVELFHRDAEFLLTQFIYQHPESPLVKQAWFQLGKFFFRDKKYKKAVQWLKQVEPDLLTEEEQAEFHFKLGYGYFKTDDYDLALSEFAQVKSGDSPYATTAAYYYGHLQYQAGNFETALEEFKKLGNDEVFGPIVPFYISQIYYQQKRYDQVILYAQPILDSTQSRRGPEIARLIGESYYNTIRYKEAIPYLEKFEEKSTQTRTREDDYQLAYAYFKNNQLEAAIPYFEKATGDQDALGQNAWYHLGWCQLNTNNKKLARNAYQEASKSDVDITIKEEALFNYAKLAYELGSDPYDEAVRALQDYINKYPDSKRMDEAYTFLANIFSTTRNYKTALASLDRIKQKTEPLKAAYQRVAYYRGLELINDKNYDEAIKHFNLSLQYPAVKDMAANANYWKAEASYRTGQYADAVKGYEGFIYSLSAFDLKNFNRANYNLAYAYYKMKDYSAALTWFRKFVMNYGVGESKLANDAFLRSGDCYFVQKSYTAAVEQYDKAIAIRGLDTDYAMFQKGKAQGVSGKLEAQIKTHQQLVSEFPTSKYADDAKWEIGRSFENLGRLEEAYAMYSGILLNHSSGTFAAGAMVQMGGIRYTQNRDDEAIKHYMDVVDNYPGSQEISEAQLGLKRIYLEQGKAAEYQAIAQDKGLKNLSKAEFDSTAWEAAEISYLKGNCEKAITQLGAYVNDFVDGLFTLKALGYKADCEMKMKMVDEAAKTYYKIIQKPKSKYTAEAYMILGIYERQKENYQEALKHFKELEVNAENAEQTIQARSNIMRISSRLGNSQDALNYAKKVVEADKVSDDLKQEARMIIARAYYAEEKYEQAMEELQRLKKVNSEIGAEAKYTIASIYFKKGEYKKCEKAIFDLIDASGAYDYWLTKGFILLADNYMQLGNIFQAKQTLQSVLDHHDKDELYRLAESKLNALNNETKPAVKEELPESDIQFNGNKKDNGLFDDAPKEEKKSTENPPKTGGENE